MKCLTALFCGVGDGGIDGDSTAPAVPVDAEIEGLSDVPQFKVVVSADLIGGEGDFLSVQKDFRGGGLGGLGSAALAGHFAAHGGVCRAGGQGNGPGGGVPAHLELLVRAAEDIGQVPELEIVAAVDTASPQRLLENVQFCSA